MDTFQGLYHGVPLVQHAIMVITPALLLQLPPSYWRKYVAVPVLTAVFYYVSTIAVHSSLILAYFHGLSVTVNYIVCLDLFLVNEYPENTDYQPKKETLESVRSARSFSLKKLNWALRRSFYVIRGVGWVTSSRTKRNQPAPPVSRTSFILRQLKLFVWQFAAVVVGKIYLRQFKYYKFEGRDLDYPNILSESPSLVDFVGNYVALSYNIFFGLDSTYRVAVLFAVATGLSTPEECPPFFNFSRFGESPPLKVFWGDVWHQWLFRNYSLCRGLTDKLFGNSSFGKIAAIYLTFVLGGLLHWYANLSFPWFAQNGRQPYHVVLVFVYWCLTLRLEDRCGQLLGPQLAKLPKLVRKVAAIGWLLVVHFPAVFVFFGELLQGGIDEPPTPEEEQQLAQLATSVTNTIFGWMT
ncbi:hypothetical protein OGAPHI_006590 [Ogataea philodendri]|uniref:Wax synthase domain-containing protein n=1 Tax=Ogataea philodendri TaxID=1378263 RepID=A0A9P8NWK0_9ASCO|nr:uncharacterized protein OGAPHI_006590 [Ogataea philodendri]KAH3661183.1 hypothetical protein OGAPHI_006590 [Ogataea philodendri]